MASPSAATRNHRPHQARIQPVDAALGAEVYDVDLRKLDDAAFKILHDAWLENVLLVVRDQQLAAADLVTLVKRFGVPVTSSNLHQRDLKERAAHDLYQLPPEVTVVSNVKEGDKTIGILGDG